MSIMTTRRRKSLEQIVLLLRQAAQLLANGEDLASVCRTLGILESSFHRGRACCGGMNLDDAKCLQENESTPLHSSGCWRMLRWRKQS